MELRLICYTTNPGIIIIIINMFQIEFDTKEIEGALPDYKYVKKLGTGAYAVVHLVEKRQTGQQFALKKVNCLGISEYDRAGAANQARILSSLEHKNLIKVHECLFDNTEDVLYLFMEYAESGDLTVLIEQAKEKKKRIPESTIWKVIADVSDGLQYLHKNQIMHRDIKPANIFRMGKNFKIGDMNVSKVIKHGIAATTKTGSPLYTAPEVWNKETYSFKCDIWSLGVLAYELCCLKVPFEGNNIIELTRKMSEGKPKSIPTVYSSTLEQVIRRMLENSPIRRISVEEINKTAHFKIKQEVDSVVEDEADNLMDTIMFPDTHQRWVNLVPCNLPPKTGRKSGSLTKSQIQENSNSKQKYKQKGDVELMVVSNAFRSSEKKIGNPPKSTSRSKVSEDKASDGSKGELKIPSSLPPIYRGNSPINQRKKQSVEKLQKSIQRRERSSSRTKRQSAIQLVVQSKSILSAGKTDS